METINKVSKRKPFKKLELIKNWRYYILIIPAAVIFFMFVYMSIPGMLLAFKNFTVDGGIFNSPWVGWDNFQSFFSNTTTFVRVTVNTFVINILNLLVGTSITILTALLLNELFNPKLKKVFQSVLFLPTFISVILVAQFVNLLLSDEFGIVNQLIEWCGGTRVDWYRQSKGWKLILLGVYIWKGLGNNLIVYLASIVGIDTELYEAARIDGAGRFKQTWCVTLPLLKPTIIILALLSIGRMFTGDFTTVYAIVGTNDALMPALDIIETYMYRLVMNGAGNFGVSAAIGLYQTVLGFVLIFGSNTLVKLYDKEYALF